jgi:methanesulfonate monooxygenase large subunit
MARNETEWKIKPEFPETHYVDSRIYAEQEIFEEEKEKIFSKVWMIACHESEVPNAGDYRTYQHPAGPPLFVVRGEDGAVRTFYNICPHRGNTLMFDPAGNAKNISCIFHLWSWDSKGNSTGITRQKEGYGDRLNPDCVGLREVVTSVDLAGFIWVNLQDDAEPLSDYLGNALELLEAPLSAEPLEVILYHRAIVKTNFKLWHDTNSELYHDFVHYHNRVTAMLQQGYWDRRYHCYKNGHAAIDSMEVRYDAYEGTAEQRKLGWPKAPDNCHVVIDLFPGITYNLRSPVFRLDTMIPLGPNEVMIEYRGLGLKSDNEDVRRQRIKDYNSIWGPCGRNLHEDLLAVMGQGKAMRKGSDSSYVIHAREENTVQDEQGMRHFYAEWSRRMGRKSSDPDTLIPAHEKASGQEQRKTASAG